MRIALEGIEALAGERMSWNDRAEDWETADGFDPDDRRGKENLKLKDCFEFGVGSIWEASSKDSTGRTT